MPRPTKHRKPYIVVFCEGESEQAYTDFSVKKARVFRAHKYNPIKALEVTRFDSFSLAFRGSQFAL